jgi:hypothetical protein
MFNTNAAPIVKLPISERITLPATIKRSDAKDLIAALFGNPASAFGAASATARRDDFVSKCAALSLAAMIHGDSSRLERIERYATTLPEYKKSKAGEIGGAIGKLIIAYREAVSCGIAARLHADFDPTSDIVNVQRWIVESPIFGTIVQAPKVQPKAIEKPASGTAASDTAASDTAASDTAASDTAASVPSVPTLVSSYADGPINRDADPSAELAANAALDAEYSRLAEIETARKEGEANAMLRMRATGESVEKRVSALCDLATDLGVKLTKVQLAQLDKLCADAQAAQAKAA